MQRQIRQPCKAYSLTDHLTTNQQRYSAVKGARDAAASQNATNKHNLSKAAHVPRRPCGLWCSVYNVYLT